MITVKATTKAGQAIINDFETATNKDRVSIEQAYKRPSSEKVEKYYNIVRRAVHTEGFQYDLTVCGAGSYFFSTIYSVIEDGIRYIIKDTASNTYRVEYAEV